MQGTCVLLAFIGCLFVVKPGFQNAALIPALIGVCGGLGAGIAYTMVRVLGTHQGLYDYHFDGYEIVNDDLVERLLKK